MREDIGDLWTYPANVRVITTNGTINQHGDLVMGRGVAKQAADRYPSLPRALGEFRRLLGNIPVEYTDWEKAELIWTFPVKHHWFEPADLALIHKSAASLDLKATQYQQELASRGRSTDITIVMPRPGCGNGQRTWAEVKPILTDLLDDRFVVLIWETEVEK